MNSLQISHSLKLVPPSLEKEFKKCVMDGYIDGYYDLHNLTLFVDIYAVFSESYLQTGDPFYFSDHESSMRDSHETLIQKNFYKLRQDVHTVLDENMMFHCWLMDGAGQPLGFKFLPVIQVW